MSQEVLIIHFQIIISLSITSLKAFSEYSGNFDIHGNTLNNTIGSQSDILELWEF